MESIMPYFFTKVSRKEVIGKCDIFIKNYQQIN